MKIHHSLIAILVMAITAPLAMAQTPATPATTKYTTAETTIGDLLVDPAARAIVDKHIPGFSENPSIGMAGGMTLRAIQPMAGDQLTEKVLTNIDADLAKLPTK